MKNIFPIGGMMKLSKVAAVALRLLRKRADLASGGLNFRNCPARMFHRGNADLQSAVSQNCILRALSMVSGLKGFEHSADCKSAIRQIANLRYKLGDPVHRPVWYEMPRLGSSRSAGAATLLFGMVAIVSALLPLHASAASPTFSTLAGYAGHGSATGTGTAARFNNPWGIAVDSSHNVYVADTDNHVIRKITSGGVVTTFAGSPGVSGTNNTVGGPALFNSPQGVAVDASGNVYVADTGNHTIRKITSGGVVTTLAGSPGLSGTNNATGGAARFYEPEGIAVNSAGTLLFVADTWNHSIRQITLAGVVSTIAGTPTVAGTNNGSALSAQFNNPEGIAVDSANNIYVGDTGNNVIRKISSLGTVTTLAGSVINFGSAEGAPGLFWGPQGVAVDGSGNVYVADAFNDTIRKVTSGGSVSTIAGSAGIIGANDGLISAARFWQPAAVAVDSSGALYVTDGGNGTVREISTGGAVTTFAGSSSVGTNDAPTVNARFFWPGGIALDNSGNSYVADSQNGTIRLVSSAGSVSTFAGLAGSFGSTDGSANNARFYGPQGTAIDSAGNVYVADTANHVIRKITPSGSVTTFAGSAGQSGSADGTGSAARFNYPRGLKVDAAGNVYVADSQNHTIRKITSAGVVTTIAGFPGLSGDIDGTSPGTGTNTARFNNPSGLAVDASGNIYVADTYNHSIRMITAAGVVSTLCGMSGVWGFADATNSDARFNLPEDIAVDFSGNLYVLDSGNHTLRLVTPSGTNWIVSTIAGSAGLPGSTDGAGSSARFNFPASVAINNVGSLAIADLANNAIRVSGATFNSAPSIVNQPQDQTANQGQSATFTVLASGSAPLAYQWQFFGTNLPGGTASSYTRTNAQAVDAGPYSVLVSNSLGTNQSSNAFLTVILPPTITNQPQSTNISQGGTATFAVGVSGTPPFSYQWVYNNTSSIPGANASTYVVTNAQPSDAGNYSVIVSNADSSVASANATLNVNPVPTPPMITAQPQSLTVAQGSNATFNVTATGSTPLSYKWLFSGTPIAGGTASNYTRLNAQAADAGPYVVIVTNAYGSATSAVANLAVVLPPVISVQPSNQMVAVSNNVTFVVGLSQGNGASYQWRQDGNPIAGATQSTLTLNSITWSDAGVYSVVISNLAGSVTSAGASLIVEQAEFTFFEDFESYSLGGLDKNTTGSANPSASNPWWTVSSKANQPNGWVTNASSGVTPHGGSQMLGATNSARQDYFNLIYRLNEGQTYYGNFMCEWWFYDPFGTNASGATNVQDYLALCWDDPVSPAADISSSLPTVLQRMSLGAYNGNVGYNYSNYQARIIGGSGGTFGSGNSWYNTATRRSIGWHHARVIVGIPNATNSAPISMYIDDMINATVTSPTVATNGFNLIELNHQFSKVGYGYYYDDMAFRAANDPWIIEQPVSVTVNEGQPATFNIVAVGTAYQWQRNGTNLPGATSSSYTVAAAGSTNTGTYVCLVTGTNGVLSSAPAVLTLIGPAQPGHFDSLALQPDHSLKLFMSGTPYTNYFLEFSANLTNWSALATLSGTNGQFQYVDPSSASNAERFYRLRSN